MLLPALTAAAVGLADGAGVAAGAAMGGGGAAAACIEVPHLLQNFAPGLFSAEQLGQIIMLGYLQWRCSSRAFMRYAFSVVPQAVQLLAVEVFLLPHS